MRSGPFLLTKKQIDVTSSVGELLAPYPYYDNQNFIGNCNSQEKKLNFQTDISGIAGYKQCFLRQTVRSHPKLVQAIRPYFNKNIYYLFRGFIMIADFITIKLKVLIRKAI